MIFPCRFLPILAVFLLAGAGCALGRQAPPPAAPAAANIPSCESLSSIPSADFAPADLRARFLECFPERAAAPSPAPSTVGAATSAPAAAGPSCDELKSIPSSKYAPPEYRDAFIKCFPERK